MTNKYLNYFLNFIGFITYLSFYVYLGLSIANMLYIILLIFTFAFIIAFRKFSIIKSLIIPFLLLLPFFLASNLFGRYRYLKQFECINEIQEFDILFKSEFEVYHGATGKWKSVGFIYMIKAELSSVEMGKVLNSYCNIKNFNPQYQLSAIPTEIATDYSDFDKLLLSKNDINDDYYLKNDFQQSDLDKADFILQVYCEQTDLLN